MPGLLLLLLLFFHFKYKTVSLHKFSNVEETLIVQSVDGDGSRPPAPATKRYSEQVKVNQCLIQKKRLFLHSTATAQATLTLLRNGIYAYKMRLPLRFLNCFWPKRWPQNANNIVVFGPQNILIYI